MPESQISPFQQVKIGSKDDPVPDGYRMVSLIELRELYGTWLNKDNLHMPMAQYLGMILDVVRTLTGYKGVHVCKMPNDLWIFQEIICARKPTVIVELGNQAGGSTMFLRDILLGGEIPDARGVIGVDIEHGYLYDKAREYPGIKWVQGDACEVFDEVASLIRPEDRVMVIEDTTHEYEHTLKVLNTYAPLVTKGQYLIVEDTLLGEFIPSGKPNDERPGAYLAVHKFLAGNQDFTIDRQREKWFVTLNPEGYLERIR